MRARGPIGILVVAALLMGVTGCGLGESATTPPACTLLNAADLQAAVGMQASTQGGGGSGARSSCVWALPNAANGSISLILVRCGSSCPGELASLAPEPAFSDAGAGAGVTTRLSSASIVSEQGGNVIEITVDHVGTNPRTALITLARRAFGHLSDHRAGAGGLAASA